MRAGSVLLTACAQLAENGSGDPVDRITCQPLNNSYAAAGSTRIVAGITWRPGSEILITGLTDSVGSIQYNDYLSQRRAQCARMQLTRRGIQPEQVESVGGRGQRELLVPHGHGVSEPKNRRFESRVR